MDFGHISYQQIYNFLCNTIANMVNVHPELGTNSETVLKEFDRYLQAVLIRCALADNDFDETEGEIIANITKYDSIMTEDVMHNFTSHEDINGVDKSVYLLPLLNNIVVQNKKDIPRFWKIAVHIVNTDPNQSELCQTIISAIQLIEIALIKTDGNVDVAEAKAADDAIGSLIDYANDRGIYFGGYDPKNVDEIVGEREAKYIRAGQYNRSGQKQEAFKIYKELAEDGHVASQYALGVMYDEGDGIPQSDALAFKWYLASAENGDAAAMNDVAVCYKNGQGTEKSFQRALDWYYKAATLGNNAGMANYGSNMFQVFQVTRDVKALKEAQTWCQKAVNAGFSQVAPLLSTINDIIQKM